MVSRFLKRFSPSGELIPDTKVKSIPLGHKRPETLAEQVARLVRHSEFSRMVAAQGMETFEEADDFDVDDDYPVSTPWEEHGDNATFDAIRSNVVAPPAPERVAHSQSMLQKAKNALAKPKSAPAATPAADSAASPVAPNNAQGDDA